MRKKLSVFLAALLAVSVFTAGCGGKKDDAAGDGTTEVTMAFCTGGRRMAASCSTGCLQPKQKSVSGQPI